MNTGLRAKGWSSGRRIFFNQVVKRLAKLSKEAMGAIHDACQIH